MGVKTSYVSTGCKNI